MHCDNSFKRGRKKLNYGLGTINEIGFLSDVQGEAMREVQPDWHLRRSAVRSTTTIPIQLIGLAIIKPLCQTNENVLELRSFFNKVGKLQQ